MGGVRERILTLSSHKNACRPIVEHRRKVEQSCGKEERESCRLQVVVGIPQMDRAPRASARNDRRALFHNFEECNAKILIVTFNFPYCLSS